MIFSAERIYSVTDGEVRVRQGKIIPDTDEVFTDFDDADRPILVDGLETDDFAVFVTLIDPLEGDSLRLPYYVTNVRTDSGTIVPAEKLERDSRSYVTPELVAKLQTISDEDLLDFSILSFVKSLDLRFPR